MLGTGRYKELGIRSYRANDALYLRTSTHAADFLAVYKELGGLCFR